MKFRHFEYFTNLFFFWQTCCHDASQQDRHMQLFVVTVNQSTTHAWLWHAVQLHQNEDRVHCISDAYKWARLLRRTENGWEVTWTKGQPETFSKDIKCHPLSSSAFGLCSDVFSLMWIFSSVGWVHRLSMFNLQLTPGYLGVLLLQHASYSVQRQSLAEERLFMLIFKFLSAAGPRALEPLSFLRGL